MRGIHTAAILAVCVLITAACTTRLANMRVYKVNNPNCHAMVVVEQGWSYPVGYVDADRRLTMIEASRLDVMGQIGRVIASPSGARVLIESCGEGHQLLCVYDVNDLTGCGDGDAAIPSVATLDPYPGAVWKMKWIGDDRLQFHADLDYGQFDKATRRVNIDADKEDDGERIWRWTLKDDVFEQLSGTRAAARAGVGG